MKQSLIKTIIDTPGKWLKRFDSTERGSKEELMNLRSSMAMSSFNDHIRMDSFQSNLLGFGTSIDKAESFSFFGSTRIDRATLDSMYATSGLIQKIVNLPINDATRKEIVIQHERAEDILDVMENLEIMKKINLAARYGRIFRLGAVLLDINDGRSMDKPVDISGIRNINVAALLDEAWLVPLDYNGITEVEYYQLATGSLFKIHRDRLLVFDGIDCGINNRIYNLGKGESIIDAIYQPFRNLTVDYNAASTLAKDFRVPIIKMEGFSRKTIGSTAATVADIKERLKKMHQLLSIINGIVIGENDAYESLTTNVGGYADLVKLAKEHLAFVSGIPHSKLFNEGPGGGLNTGAGLSEEKDWANTVEDFQASYIRPQVRKIIRYIGAALGIRTKIPFWFTPLLQQTELDQARTEETNARRDALYVELGAITVEGLKLHLKEKALYSEQTLQAIETESEVDILVGSEIANPETEKITDYLGYTLSEED